MSPSPQPNEVFGVVCDSGGNVYLTGTANGGLLLAYSVGATTTSVSIATCWGYIVKYSASGVIQWAARIGRDEVTIGYSVKVDSAGDVYVTGQTASTFGFAAFNSDGTFFGSSSQPDVDRGTGVFMVKYNPAGRVQWLTRLNGGGSDQGRGITLDPSGNIYQIGDFGSAGFVATNA